MKDTSKLEEILKIETKDLGAKVLKLIDVNQAKADLLAWHREECEREVLKSIRKDRLANAKFWKCRIDEMFDEEIEVYRASLEEQE